MSCARILVGDVLARLRDMPDESVHCAVTSPPYWGLRDYGMDGQIGLEATPDEWCARLVEVFLEVRRVLRKDGTLWLNVGDSFASLVAARMGRDFIGVELNADYAAMAKRRIRDALPLFTAVSLEP